MGSLSSVRALNYARLISMSITCMRSSLSGSYTGLLRPGSSVVAMLSIILNDSSGGVGANMASWPAMRISLATSLLRMFGWSSSPLFVSTHLTEMGFRPILALASLIVLIYHTPLDLK